MLGEKKRRVTDIFLEQRYNLAFPSMFDDSDSSAVCILNRSHTRRLWKCVPQCPIELQESWEQVAPSDTQARKVHSSAINQACWVRMGEQRVEGEEGGVQRDHRGCKHTRTVVKATVQLRPEAPGKHFRRYPRNFRMPYINSCTTPIFRAAMHKTYLVYNKHILILLYFMV